MKYNVDNAILERMKTKTYLDYNASAPLLPDAWKAMQSVYEPENAAHNASAVHYFGREGRKIVEKARIHLAELINIPPAQVIFNSGATEGNNTILRYFAHKYPNDKILVSAADHASIVEAEDVLDNIIKIPVESSGLIDIKALEELLTNNTVSLVSCMMVNNETGLIQNVSEISERAHRYGALFHCDATQAAGRITINPQDDAIDFLTLSAHKIGGSQGVGALALGLCGQDPALMFGGGQEKSLRAGTENVAGIAGFGAAAQYAHDNLENFQNLKTLRDTLENKIKQISPEAIIHCEDQSRVANTTFFSLPGTDSQSLLMAFDLEGIALSNGSACSSGTVKPSHVLKAMGMDEKIAASALRISTGWATKEDDIDAFANAWQKIYNRVK